MTDEAMRAAFEELCLTLGLSADRDADRQYADLETRIGRIFWRAAIATAAPAIREAALREAMSVKVPLPMEDGCDVELGYLRCLEAMRKAILALIPQKGE